ncbi:tryptophan synthase subunit alpha [Flaviaesturariibacter flavus]|uniref:Tryptophan synthase alpha chain n=1 Tax=Flaviaesturariibacter flavus TaxID=2502780 RepID=A0A4R1BA31_9BACT|nr:tryptophan synthase subunit alpha [Flaviaesturariibacter flavus]TCJ13758.1 tryptophan synthase subunit alpha [Flaviaesturariibacter flavus]
MSRLTELFERKKRRVLNVYCTAGYPGPDDTRRVLRALQAGGADIIELGMPYSDPLADGPVIQASSARALAGGMTIEKLFAQLEGFREEIHLPLVLMGYLNPLLQYGFERFCARAAALGVDGLIIPDLPLAAYEREYRSILEQHGLHLVFLVTPETPEARVRQLDAASSGFLYAVSSSSVTGAVKDFDAVEKYLLRLQELRLRNPVLVGFGIRDKASFDAACRQANGAIIGSAYIEALGKGADVESATAAFLQEVLG